ncbi:hypothetical protein K4K60_010831 [Colletotrichum sp. SAR11_57]|nr:hypothetical protein K4K60_010831 [Colletotrichum sp. SAR11_57]
MIWDVIVVGGGLAGSVISNRLAGYRPELKILVVEAGPNANDRQDIVWPNSTNTIGGDFDWKLASVPQVHVDNRFITLAQGKALGGGTVINMGIELANGTHILGRQTILSAGAVHTPQLLMLSGVGPRDELEAVGVDVKLDAPEVGKNYADHFLSPSSWNVKNPEEGWAVGSPAFPTAQQYSWGTATDFIVCSSVSEEGLAKAIEEDEGVAPGPDHPLLKQKRTFFEHFFLYSGSADGSKVAISGIFILPTSRGSIKLASGNITDSPLIDPNYLATAVDRYIVREGIRQEIAFAGSDKTVLGREILNGEAAPAGFDEPYTVNSTDEYIDARIRAAARSVHHPMGSTAMGKVVDGDLKVKGVRGLRVVDASVFPVVISAHLQVATFALAEQAAEIIAKDY